MGWMSAAAMHDGFVRAGGRDGTYYPRKCFEKEVGLESRVVVAMYKAVARAHELVLCVERLLVWPGG
jgi:hypothetical protein